MENKETLEEVAENYVDQKHKPSSGIPNKGIQNFYDCRNAFKDGAKWQQEQDKNKYSEEEVLDILREFYKISSKKDFPLTNTIPLWFEQFKKK